MKDRFLKMAQLDMHAHVMTVDYLDILFGRLAACGYNAVLLAYRDKFPYTSYPELSAPDAYTPEQVAEIDRMAVRHGLEIVPLGFQFSHASAIVQHPRFKHLAGDGGLDLLNDESVEVIVKTARDILRAHPSARLVHTGGDEMGGFGGRPAIGRYVRTHGASQYYVQFVNKLATALRSDGIRVGIWSDMLIRYPEALPALDTSAVIFYWDYWSYGERTPFVTIGGGLPDMYILDWPGFRGDLRKLFLVGWPKPPADLPWDHVRRFERYWQMDPAGKSVRSFPYAAWFRDHGLDVVGALTTYPEKSSFLPDFLGKFSHVRAFSQRLRESGGMGCLACLWAMHFPLPETVWPSWLAASIFMDQPGLTDDEVCALTAERLGGHWTPATVKDYFGVGSDFEAADLIAPTWSDKLSLVERMTWLREAGALEDDMAMCRASRAKAEALLNGAWKTLSPDVHERFMLEDTIWRARLQIAWHEGRAAEVPALRQAGQALERRCDTFLKTMYVPKHAADILARRYQAWFRFLDDIEKGMHS
jgi:hypothetical protein